MTTPTDDRDELVELISPMAFGQTLARVTAAIEGAGLTIFAQIDHAAAASAAGLSMPPTTVLVYGRAEGGTPLMQAAPQVALELPLRVLVREESALRTVVAFRPIAATLARLGVPQALVHRLDPAQDLLRASLR